MCVTHCCCLMIILHSTQTSNWDEGKGLELPRLPHHGVQLEHAAHDFISQNKLTATSIDTMVDVFVQMRLVEVRKESLSCSD